MAKKAHTPNRWIFCVSAYIDILATREYNPIDVFVFANNRQNLQPLTPDEVASLYKGTRGISVNRR